MAKHRTNNAEREVIERLEGDNYEVLSRGWPDLIAIHPNGKVRLIEVKPANRRQASPAQRKVHRALASLGIHVEIWNAKSHGVTPSHILKEMYKDIPPNI